MAEVSGGLLGLFVVGILFFVETGFRRLDEPGEHVVEAYFRASTRIVLILFVIPLSLSLTLVVLEDVWSRVLFALLSIALVAANLDTAGRIRRVRQRTGSRALVFNELAGSVAVALAVVIPWALGGIEPSREDLTWAVLLSFGSAVASVFVLVLSIFDLASAAASRPPADRAPPA
jgi:hypothetical protein